LIFNIIIELNVSVIDIINYALLLEKFILYTASLWLLFILLLWLLLVATYFMALSLHLVAVIQLKIAYEILCS